MYEWQQRNLRSSLPHALRRLRDAGNLDNLRLAIQPDREPRHPDGGQGAGGPRPPGQAVLDPRPRTGYHGLLFMDSDIYKTLGRSAGN